MGSRTTQKVRTLDFAGESSTAIAANDKPETQGAQPSFAQSSLNLQLKLNALKLTSTLATVFSAAILALIGMLPLHWQQAGAIATAIGSLCILVGGLMAGYLTIVKSVGSGR